MQIVVCNVYMTGTKSTKTGQRIYRYMYIRTWSMTSHQFGEQTEHIAPTVNMDTHPINIQTHIHLYLKL